MLAIHWIVWPDYLMCQPLIWTFPVLLLTILYLLSFPPRCFFFGDISSKRDPDTYLKCIFGLYNYFIKEHYQLNELGSPGKLMLPLIINTPGWVKGVVLEIFPCSSTKILFFKKCRGLSIMLELRIWLSPPLLLYGPMFVTYQSNDVFVFFVLISFFIFFCRYWFSSFSGNVEIYLSHSSGSDTHLSGEQESSNWHILVG